MLWRAIALAALALPAVVLPGSAQSPRRAVVLEISGAIGPAVADYIIGGIAQAGRESAGLVVLRMDTPGGLAASMRKMVSAILASPVPVATFVAPSGARAASAGTYIAYASAVVAMAPGTNIGAATPVQLGGGFLGGEKKKDENQNASEPADTETRKLVNDSVAYIRSLAELNKRNADWAERAVRAAASLTASAALKENVIDVIADDVPDLLRKIDGRSAIVAGKPVRLQTSGLQIVEAPPGWRTQLMALITDPNIAFLLMLVGIYGIVFEFAAPGTLVPGTIGGICLLLAAYALNLLPINYAGVALVVLGIALMIAEVHIGSFGVVGIAGVVSFAIGSFMMFNSGIPGFELSFGVIAAATAATGAFFLLVLGLLLRSHKRPVITGKEALLGAEGESLDWQQEEGRVRVLGEVWRARSARPLAPGTRVKVIDREGLVLFVEPA